MSAHEKCLCNFFLSCDCWSETLVTECAPAPRVTELHESKPSRSIMSGANFIWTLQWTIDASLWWLTLFEPTSTSQFNFSMEKEEEKKLFSNQFCRLILFFSWSRYYWRYNFSILCIWSLPLFEMNVEDFIRHSKMPDIAYVRYAHLARQKNIRKIKLRDGMLNGKMKAAGKLSFMKKSYSHCRRRICSASLKFFNVADAQWVSSLEVRAFVFSSILSLIYMSLQRENARSIHARYELTPKMD